MKKAASLVSRLAYVGLDDISDELTPIDAGSAETRIVHREIVRALA